MRKKPTKPDENRGFLVRGFRRERSENASGILATLEAAGTEAACCRIPCRSERTVYLTESTDGGEAERWLVAAFRAAPGGRSIRQKALTMERHEVGAGSAGGLSEFFDKCKDLCYTAHL